MRTGRLSISRGHPPQAAEETPLPQLALVPPVAAPAPAGNFDAVNERLSALERLVRLSAGPAGRILDDADRALSGESP